MSPTSAAAGPPKLPAGDNKPFRFLDLSAELRNRVYELSTNVLEYEPRLKFAKGDEKFRPRAAMSPELAYQLASDSRRQIISYDEVHIGTSPAVYGHQKPARPTPLPGILGVSKQVSSEAFSIFYCVNPFTFNSCKLEYLARWIYDTVGTNKIHLRDVGWQGYGPYDEREVVVAAALLALEAVGILKDRALWLYELGADHMLCRLRRFIKDATVNDRVFGQSKEDIMNMTLDELVSILKAPVGEWWKKLPKVQKRQSCPVCSVKEALK